MFETLATPSPTGAAATPFPSETRWQSSAGRTPGVHLRSGDGGSGGERPPPHSGSAYRNWGGYGRFARHATPSAAVGSGGRALSAARQAVPPNESWLDADVSREVRLSDAGGTMGGDGAAGDARTRPRAAVRGAQGQLDARAVRDGVAGADGAKSGGALPQRQYPLRGGAVHRARGGARRAGRYAIAAARRAIHRLDTVRRGGMDDHDAGARRRPQPFFALGRAHSRRCCRGEAVAVAGHRHEATAAAAAPRPHRPRR
eukprot:ctg_3807.g409